MDHSLRQPATLEQLVNPTERQREFLQAIAEHDFVLYGGEAGGGKSYILRWWLVIYLVWLYRALHLKNVMVGLFCEDYPTLNDRQVSKIKFEFPDWLGRLREGSVHNFVLNPEYGGGILALRNLDDPSKYYSAEFAGIAVDELTRNPKAIFDDLRFRLRWPGVERPKFGAGTNPGGPGHAWVKKYWITKEYPPEFKGVDKRTGKAYDITGQFSFVRAQASDNPHLTGNYHTGLLTLPPEMSRRVAHGDWDVYTGQFYPQFNEADPITKIQHRHVIPAEEANREIKPWWTCWLSGDWGYEHPHTILGHAQSETGKVITFGEMWGRRVSETDLGLAITEKFKGRKLRAFPFSWDAGKLSPRSKPNLPKSMMQLVADALGPNIPQPHPADSSPGSRVSGARLLGQLLDADMWQISDACPKLIACLPTLIHDEDNLEDVLKVEFSENEIGDDPYDAARMGLQHMVGTPMLPVAVVAERRVAQYAATINKEVEELDINTAAQLHRRALAQEYRRRGARRGGLGRIWRPQIGD